MDQSLLPPPAPSTTQLVASRFQDWENWSHGKVRLPQFDMREDGVLSPRLITVGIAVILYHLVQGLCVMVGSY